MNAILPTCAKDFHSEKYWNRFFEKCQNNPFEWYGDYSELEQVFRQELNLDKGIKILNVGCGNSSLSADIYDNLGFRSLWNVDFSKNVIQAMSRANTGRPEMEWVALDVSKGQLLDFFRHKELRFSAMIDKGFLDAFSTSDDAASAVADYFTSAWELLLLHGKYILITLGQADVIDHVLRFFARRSCEIRVIPILLKSRPNAALQPFCVVIHKLSPESVVSFKFPAVTVDCSCLPFEVDSRDCPTPTFFTMKHIIKQLRALLRCHAGRKEFCPGHMSKLSLRVTDDATESYDVTIYDKEVEGMQSSAGAIAVFHPSRHRAHWNYSTPAGLKELCENVECRRIICVSSPELNNDNYGKGSQGTCREAIIQHLRDVLGPALAPLSLGEKLILTVPEDDLVDQRTLVGKLTSEYAGEVEIYDRPYTCDDCTRSRFVRSMIFSKNPRVSQSEVVYELVEETAVFDYMELNNEYHRTIVAVILAITSPDASNHLTGAVLGLGAGVLPLCLKGLYRSADLHLDLVDIDPVIVKVATDYFGFRKEPGLEVYVSDAAAFVDRRSNDSFNGYEFIVVDINSTDDGNTELVCPPTAFLTEKFLANCSTLIATDGILVFNYLARNQKVLEAHMSLLRRFFAQVVCLRVATDLNKIIVCSKVIICPPKLIEEYLCNKLQACVTLTSGLSTLCSEDIVGRVVCV